VKRSLLVLACAVAAFQGFGGAQQALDDTRARESAAVQLTATRHAPLPSDASQYWFVQDGRDASGGEGRAEAAIHSRFVKGVQAVASKDFSGGLALLNGLDLQGTPLAGYARYYTGVALAGLSRYPEADALFTSMMAMPRDGFLREAVPLRLAEVAVARQDAARAEVLLRALVAEPLAAPEEAMLALALVEEGLNHREHALELYRRIYYDSPLSAQAVDAQNGIERLQSPSAISADLVGRAQRRAQRLFDARRWAQARAGFEAIANAVSGDTKDLVALRIAECDFYLNRHRIARDALKRLLSDDELAAEARFFHLSAIQKLGDRKTFVTLARELVADFPNSEWAAEALNSLALQHVVVDEDDEAAAVFRELVQRFPRHRHAERAAWKAGWAAYRNGRFDEAVTVFESAAAAFPRADYRPSWLYWSARSRDQLNDTGMANERYRLVVADYGNSYYGRLSARLLTTRKQPVLPAVATTTAPTSVAPVNVPPNEALIRELTSLQLYDDALREVQYAQRVWGDSAPLQATTAWIRNRQGMELRAAERFNAVRGAITLMRRAYPQFLAAGGEDLPADVLQIIFPLDYWPLIQKYSKLHGLDPYLITALMAQESTFTAEIRSSANARGLMQLLPSTGRIYARKVGMKSFTTASLNQPEINVRLGTQYFKELMERFGGAHYALAGYNAGEHRVVRWLKEAPGLPADEFVDNIPFPETQNYVKRILGTAEDYRRLYGAGLLDPNGGLTASR
jgi:soluble lytic murein transglycosylase